MLKSRLQPLNRKGIINCKIADYYINIILPYKHLSDIMNLEVSLFFQLENHVKSEQFPPM